MGLWNAGKLQTNGGAPSRPHTAPAHQWLRHRNRKGKEAEDAIRRQEDVELQQLKRGNHFMGMYGTLITSIIVADYVSIVQLFGWCWWVSATY
jgi:hypothetical protein